MRAILLYTAAALLVLGYSASAASAEETAGPDAFASLLLAHHQYGPGPDDGELLDLWLNHINETDPDLLGEPVCYAPLMWEWPDFFAYTTYTAEDEYGEWDVAVELDGVMDLNQLVTIDGVDYPYIASLSVSYSIAWRGQDGSSFSTDWGYILQDIPPVAAPASDLFLQGLPDGLPGDRLTYSLHLQGDSATDPHLADYYYYSSTADPQFPESDYHFENGLETVAGFEFDMIMYYMAD